MEGLDEYRDEVVSRLEQLDPETDVDFRYKDEIDETVSPEKALEVLDEYMASRDAPDGTVSVKDWYLDVDVRENGELTEIQLEKGTQYPDNIQEHEERDAMSFADPKRALVTAELRYRQ